MTWPVVLTIAGSDSGGGAGIQADIKTLQALGCYGTSVITAITAQNTESCLGVHPVPVEHVAQQLDAVTSDFELGAVKCGMLGTGQIVEKLCEWMSRRPPTALVVDPVLISTSGAPLLDKSGQDLLRQRLLRFVHVLTPNLPEASALTGIEISDDRHVERAARELARLGPSWIVLKGGHASNSPEVKDFVFEAATGASRWLVHPRIETNNLHGTGCTFASAIAAMLARGEAPLQAIERAREFVQGAIQRGVNYHLGRGRGPLKHL